MILQTEQGPKALIPREAQSPVSGFQEKPEARRGLCLRNKASHPGEWSEADNPTREPIDNIEWKAKPPVNKKAVLFQVEENRSVEGRAGG